MTKRRALWMLVPIAVAVIGIGVLTYFWNLLSPYWAAEEKAAAYVLDHTPLDRLKSYSVFTAAGVEDVFQGQDGFGRTWYAFYVPSMGRAFTLPSSAVLSDAAVKRLAAARGLVVQSISLGYVASNPSAPTWAKSGTAVYEVMGRSQGHLTFLYFDATTGRLLWQYSLVRS
ncbi:hypothetical protein IW967_06055 [Alicyclobacillus mali]|uniref:DUF5590 domain-containing protein n=1 Tax=Alicyclobacillus mali (ex Roth et al. 2021) TaxID=1123961 RepID=A0ABS0F2C7_9BACL|nr:hypothetical protein [Alicyclobacillus mali (ex Roth et al. 2021)]MBF8377437.1 hypothetical protein [Alicyclobacillus mali (ex Roth et al. 2021)]MCL6487405.1 hypothetical protein [Alicyclobacillus mali (ex Roth et al. 2021)]